MAVKTELEKAVDIALNCARAKRIAGHLADVPYSQAELCSVIATLLAEFDNFKAAVATANRRYAASNARYQRLAKMTGKSVAEDESAATA
jgi:hypothetical protein